jgi:hypothetical protein
MFPMISSIGEPLDRPAKRFLSQRKERVMLALRQISIKMYRHLIKVFTTSGRIKEQAVEELQGYLALHGSFAHIPPTKRHLLGQRFCRG